MNKQRKNKIRKTKKNKINRRTKKTKRKKNRKMKGGSQDSVAVQEVINLTKRAFEGLIFEMISSGIHKNLIVELIIEASNRKFVRNKVNIGLNKLGFRLLRIKSYYDKFYNLIEYFYDNFYRRMENGEDKLKLVLIELIRSSKLDPNRQEGSIENPLGEVNLQQPLLPPEM